MHSDQKLTRMLAGRTISGTAQAKGLLTITFIAEPPLKVMVVPSNTNAAATGGKVAKVRQQGTDLILDLEGGGSVPITTAEATSSVMLRDRGQVGVRGLTIAACGRTPRKSSTFAGATRTRDEKEFDSH